MKTKSTKRIKAVVLLFTNLIAVPGFGKGPDKKAVFETRSFPNNLKEDGFWAGIYTANDGKVYIGLNTEGGGSAQFYIYDPKKDNMRHRADMSEFLGERGKGLRTHAKIHTRFCEDREGRIYFATGNMGAGPAEVDPRTWLGGHWCRYDPAADSLEDLGLVLPYSGVYGLTIDPVRMRLYGVADNGHFVLFDIATQRTIDKGRVNNDASSAARTLVADDRGNVYGTCFPDRFFKYDVNQDRLLDLSVQIPCDPDVLPRSLSIYKQLMRAGVWDPVSRRMFGVEGATSYLFEYDPYIGNQGQVRKLGQLLPENETESLRRAHYATLSFVLGKNRKIYYLPIGPLEPPDENKNLDFFKWAGQAHLVAFDLQSGVKEDLGPAYTEDGLRIVDHQNRAPSGGGATGPDGTLYFCGFVEERNPEKVGFVLGKIPARLRLLMYKPS